MLNAYGCAMCGFAVLPFGLVVALWIEGMIIDSVWFMAWQDRREAKRKARESRNA